MILLLQAQGIVIVPNPSKNYLQFQLQEDAWAIDL